MSEQTFMASAGKGGDGKLWRSEVLSDGTAVTPYFRAPGMVVFLLDTANVPHLLTCTKDSEGVRTDDGHAPLAPVPYAGSMATVLSTIGGAE